MNYDNEPFQLISAATESAPEVPVVNTDCAATVREHNFALTAWQQGLLAKYEETGAALNEYLPHSWNIHRGVLAEVAAKMGSKLPTNSGCTNPNAVNGSMHFQHDGTVNVYSYSNEGEGWKKTGKGFLYRLRDPSEATTDEAPKSKAECILAIAERDEHYHSGKTPIVGLVWNGKKYTFKLPSDEYIRLLMVRVRSKFGKLVTERDVRNVLPHVIQHCYDGPEKQVFTRVGCHDERIYIDLGDHRAIEIDAGGWRIVDTSPVTFIQNDLTTVLPDPVSGGSLHELQPYLNLSDDDFAVAIAYLIGCWRPLGPFPSLAFVGPAGIAKSTTVRFMQAVVDPSTAPNGKQRACHSPSNPEDVLVHAAHRWFVFLDNLSKMGDKLSDLCCLFATGGGTIKRRLYSDSDFAELSVEQPLVLAMVNDLVQKEDLRSRMLFLFPPMLNDYRPEREMMDEFDRVLPRIIGALADAVSSALRNQAQQTDCGKLRFADFIQWVVAAEPATDFERGTFLRLISANRRHSAEQVVDTPFGNAICELANEGVTMRVGELFQRLRSMGVEDISNGVWLSRRLNEMNSEFAQCGVVIEKRNKRWHIRRG